MLPKLHKWEAINEIMEIKGTSYIQTDEDILIEGQLIVAVSVFHTSWISKNFTFFYETCFTLILRIFKDSFNFRQRLKK